MPLLPGAARASTIFESQRGVEVMFPAFVVVFGEMVVVVVNDDALGRGADKYEHSTMSSPEEASQI